MDFIGIDLADIFLRDLSATVHSDRGLTVGFFCCLKSQNRSGVGSILRFGHDPPPSRIGQGQRVAQFQMADHDLRFSHVALHVAVQVRSFVRRSPPRETRLRFRPHDRAARGICTGQALRVNLRRV